jgi:hypothetical protein
MEMGNTESRSRQPSHLAAISIEYGTGTHEVVGMYNVIIACYSTSFATPKKGLRPLHEFQEGSWHAVPNLSDLRIVIAIVVPIDAMRCSRLTFKLVTISNVFRMHIQGCTKFSKPVFIERHG